MDIYEPIHKEIVKIAQRHNYSVTTWIMHAIIEKIQKDQLINSNE